MLGFNSDKTKMIVPTRHFRAATSRVSPSPTGTPCLARRSSRRSPQGSKPLSLALAASGAPSDFLGTRRSLLDRLGLLGRIHAKSNV